MANFSVLSRNWLEESHKNFVNLSYYSGWADRDSNHVPPEHKSRTLPLHQYARPIWEVPGSIFDSVSRIHKYVPGWLQ